MLNFETITLLSRIEAKYQELKDQETYIFPIVFGPPIFKKGDDGWEYRKGLEFWMMSYINNKRELLALYDEFGKIFSTRRTKVKFLKQLRILLVIGIERQITEIRLRI